MPGLTVQVNGTDQDLRSPRPCPSGREISGEKLRSKTLVQIRADACRRWAPPEADPEIRILVLVTYLKDDSWKH